MGIRVCDVCATTTRSREHADKAVRGRPCPRYGHVHWSCCASEECSYVTTGGAVRCGFAKWRRRRESAPFAERTSGAP